MKKILVLFLLVALCLPVIAACSTLKGDTDKGATINMNLSSFPQTLDPAAVQLDADTSTILALIFQPLTSVNKKGEVVGALASEWYSYYDKRENEHKMYFVLNETKWSDGITVSADDVVYAWKRILSPEFESPFASLLFPIKNAFKVKSGVMTSDDLGLVAEDDFLLSVTFEKEYDINLFAEMVSCIALSPLREDIITKSIKDNVKNERNQDWDKNAAIIVCNGPFRLQGLEEGIKLVLERNAYFYRDVEEDALDKSVIPFRLNCIYQEATLPSKVDTPISEQQFQLNRFKDGKIYYLSDFTKDTFSSLSKDITTSSMLSTYSYYFNTTNKILSDARVRRALSIALDRQAIADLVGKGYKAIDGFVPSGVFNTEKGTDFRAVGGALYSKTGDLEKAKSLLKEAGVSGGELKLTYLIGDHTSSFASSYAGKVSYYKESEITAAYAKSVWESLGLKITLVPVYADTFNQALSSREFDIIGLDYVMNCTDAFGYLAPFAKRFSGSKVSIDFESETFTPHYTGLQNDDYDALIDSIVYVSDRAKRAELLHQAEAKFVELCPATALFQYSTSYIISDNIDKYSTNYFGFNDFSNLRMKDYIEVNSK
ncbi:MAG: peptide ABC transporter substrate-binding protein, partial [Clostridia bacterium]